MRRWDRLQDSYMEEYRARGLSPETVACTDSRLDRWGRWLKKRRPRVVIEQIGAEVITHYIATCTSFRSKATVPISAAADVPDPELLRPLLEYERLVGGRW